MPTYEYVCKACGHAFEKFQSMTAAPIKKCPECGKNQVQRLIGTGAALIFKGSGFYITDYRSEGYKTSEKADSGSSTPATSDAKSETKSESTKESKGSGEPKPAPEPKKVEKKSESKPSKKSKD